MQVQELKGKREVTINGVLWHMNRFGVAWRIGEESVPGYRDLILADMVTTLAVRSAVTAAGIARPRERMTARRLNRSANKSGPS